MYLKPFEGSLSSDQHTWKRLFKLCAMPIRAPELAAKKKRGNPLALAYSEALKNTMSSFVPKLPAWWVMSLQMSTTSLPPGHSGVLSLASHATIPTSFMPGSRVTGTITPFSASA